MNENNFNIKYSHFLLLEFNADHWRVFCSQEGDRPAGICWIYLPGDKRVAPVLNFVFCGIYNDATASH